MPYKSDVQLGRVFGLDLELDEQPRMQLPFVQTCSYSAIIDNVSELGK